MLSARLWLAIISLTDGPMYGLEACCAMAEEVRDEFVLYPGLQRPTTREGEP